MKIIRDTLQTPSGKWSRKSLTMFVSFFMACITGIYIVISDFVLDHEINRHAISVFDGFLVMSATLCGITLWDKLKTGLREDDSEPRRPRRPRNSRENEDEELNQEEPNEA